MAQDLQVTLDLVIFCGQGWKRPALGIDQSQGAKPALGGGTQPAGFGLVMTARRDPGLTGPMRNEARSLGCGLPLPVLLGGAEQGIAGPALELAGQPIQGLFKRQVPGSVVLRMVSRKREMRLAVQLNESARDSTGGVWGLGSVARADHQTYERAVRPTALDGLQEPLHKLVGYCHPVLCYCAGTWLGSPKEGLPGVGEGCGADLARRAPERLAAGWRRSEVARRFCWGVWV